MKSEIMSKLAVSKSFRDSGKTAVETPVPEIKSALSANFTKFMKSNGLKLSLSKRSSSSSVKNTVSNEFGIISENFPEEFLIKYELVKKINEGMQGRVCQIREKATGLDFAAKIYVTNDGEKISMIKNEARIMSLMSHPNIIRFEKFYSLEEEGLFIIISEFFPSVSLETYIQENSASTKEKLMIAATLISIISYLEDNNITHGDFNLSNILINPETLQIKLIDFGLSRQRALEMEFLSPKGFLFYRPPVQMQIFYQSDLYDIWGLMLVLFSVFLCKKICSNRLLKQFEEVESKSRESEEDGVVLLTTIFKKLLIGPKEPKNLKDSIKLMKNFLSTREA